MDQLLENALAGKYNGEPMKYVSLYNDFTEAKIPYSFLQSFQYALYQGKLVDCINQYMKDNWTRP